ncbi:hypothetical protein PPERSA_01529 [Pseudocohnilembus persalinus]|uniref:Transmembrane protein n=1 Tax=Pseudocohnilembus persalinus TaxID=266149 RepID=A0A0V0R8E5_PSEPJ|nr:hypothetical protein PPERSA_01529 [Pseudocohnilembus persalinus]|eukprot:KRX10517.1 hypothetical protein PPERSA_01529 [Pseudocohnilembus persalinus]
MFKLNPSKFQLKQASKYDLPGFTTPEKRRQILQVKMLANKKFHIKGGTSQTNPYKDIQDLIIADRRELVQKYQKSVLWSPKYTPWHFKNFFLYPAMGVVVLMFYIRYIAVPRNMKRLKEKGYNFPDLEEKGWLDGWLDDDEDNDEFSIIYEMEGDDLKSEFEKQQQPQINQYSDWTMKDLYNFDKANKKTVADQANELRSKQSQAKREKMQDKFNQFYQYRQEISQPKTQ